MAAITPPVSKIPTIIKRYQHFKQKSQEQSQELRFLRAKLGDLTQSREKWKSQAKELKKQLRSVRKGGLRSARPRGHRYSTHLIELCLKLYLLGQCSLRGASSVVGLLLGGSRPSKSTIANWLRKAGYYVYSRYPDQAPPGGYALILDESMTLGQQRMLYGLLVPAHKSTRQALGFADILGSVLGVKPSWKAVDVVAFLRAIRPAVRQQICYVVSDFDTTLCKALSDAQLVRIADVGHEIGRFLAATYQTAPDFKAFTSDLAQVKFREIMKPTAYLLPPQARAIARFMNLSTSVEWARRLRQAWPQLSAPEQQTFGFIHHHRALIEELVSLFSWINPLLKDLKQQGLSKANLQSVYAQLAHVQQQAPTQRAQALAQRIQQYLQTEQAKLPHSGSCYHMSSDIIESSFGRLKIRQSPNKLNGVTASVLLLALMTKVDKPGRRLQLDVRQAMEQVTLKMVTAWANQTLLPNQVQRRRKVLKK